MKRFTKLLVLTAGVAVLAFTSSAGVILDTDYTTAGTPSYSDGNVSGQNGWLGQNTPVTNAATFGEVAVLGGFIRTTYGNGVRGGTGGVPNGVGTFAVGDIINLQYDLQFNIKLPINNLSDIAIIGFLPQNLGSFTPTNGFRVQYNQYHAGTGGSVKFFPSVSDGSGNNALALIINGTEFGLDYTNTLGAGTNAISDLMRVYYQISYTGASVWQVDSLVVSNRVKNTTYSYTGATRTYVQPGTDLFLGQGLGLLSAGFGFRVASDGVRLEYIPAPDTRVWNGNAGSDWSTAGNWKTNGVAGVTYQDGVPIRFDDTASGAGAVSVLLNTTVYPMSVTIDNTNRAYSIGTSSFGDISGTTGVNKSGPGTVSLSTYNYYSGPTRILAGKLVGVTSGSIVSSDVTVSSGATNGVRLSTADTSFTVKTLTCNAGTTYLDFDIGAFTPSAFVAPLDCNNGFANSLTANPGVKIIVRNGTGWTVGTTYPLIKYTGTFTAMANIAILGLPAGVYGQLINDTFTQTIGLAVTVPPKIWNGNLSAVWDVATTANWKDVNTASGLFYNESGPFSDLVYFDDTCTAVDPVSVTLDVPVYPYTVVVNNTNKHYTIAGTGSINNTTGNLLKTGPGTLTLSTLNTYTGGTDIRSGSIKVGATDALPTGAVTVQTGGTLDLNGNNQTVNTLVVNAGNITGAGVLTLGANPTLDGVNTIAGGSVELAANRQFNVNSGVTTLGSLVTGAGLTLSKNGAGVLVLTNRNTYDLGTTLLWGAGYTRIGADGAFGPGPLVLYNGSRISSDGAIARVITNALTIGDTGNAGPYIGDAANPGKLTFTGPINLAGDGPTKPQPRIESPVEFSGPVDDGATTRDLYIYGNGGLTLSGTNTYKGKTEIMWGNGPLRLANDYALPSATLLIHNNGKMSAAGSAMRTITNAVTLGDNDGSSVLGDVAPNDGTLVFTGPITINGLNTGGVSIQTPSDVIMNGVLSQSAATRSLTKLSAGKLTLAGANTYAGGTFVQAGTLLINGSVASGATVTGGTLGGTGTINGATAVNGGTLAPGAAIGTLNLNGDLAFGAGGSATIEVNKTSGTKDLAAVTGTLTYGGTLVVTNLSGALASGDSFKVFNATAYAGQFGALSAASPGAGLAWDLSSLPVDGTLKVASVVNPTVSDITSDPALGATLNINGGNGQSYTVLTSTDVGLPLVSWTVLAQGIFNGAPVAYTDASATNASAKFYRVSVP